MVITEFGLISHNVRARAISSRTEKKRYVSSSGEGRMERGFSNHERQPDAAATTKDNAAAGIDALVRTKPLLLGAADQRISKIKSIIAQMPMTTYFKGQHTRT